MQSDDSIDDIRAIGALIAEQFQSLRWRPGAPPDWSAFSVAFAPDAMLFPAARPASATPVAAFIARMEALRTSNALTAFEEAGLGQLVHVFGNVAIAMAACSMLENETTVTRDVSAFLLIKDSGVWRIAAQAWDVENSARRIPEHLSRASDA